MIDELTTLRDARPTVVPADPLVVLKARRALLRRAVARRARRRIVIRVATGVAACLVFVVAVGNVTLGGGQHGSTSQAAAAAVVLQRAAAQTLGTSDLVTRPGQWLKWTYTDQEWVALRDSHNQILTGSDGEPDVFRSRRDRTLWIPHNIKEPWIDRDGTTPGSNISRDTAPYNVPETARTVEESSWADKSTPRHYGNEYDPAWYATLPRDPQALLDRLMDDNSDAGVHHSMNWYFQEIFSPVLISPIAPAAIRAALFQALAATPGIQVADGVTNLDGRPAVAIRYGDTGHQWLFDRKTGLFVGERETSPDFPDVKGLDPAKTTSLTSVQVTVVDHAPTPDVTETQLLTHHDNQ